MNEYVSDQTLTTLTEAYNRMERLPGQIVDVISVYAEQIEKEEKRHDRVVEALTNTLNVKKAGIEQARTNALSKADADKAQIMSSMNELKRQMDRELELYDSDIKYLSGSNKINPSIGRGLGHVLGQVRAKKQASEKAFSESYHAIVQQEQSIYNDKVQSAENTYKEQLGETTRRYKEDIDLENSKSRSNSDRIYEEARISIEALEPALIKSLYEMILINTPQNDNYEAAVEMPEAIQMGSLYTFLDEWEDNELMSPVIELVRDSFSFALRTIHGRSALMFPYGNAFSDYKLSKFITYDRGNREAALDYLRAAEMRLFMSIPCGKLRVTMMDPVDSGSNFSMFSCLGDDDERIISTRIWCDPKRIKEQLNLLIAQIEHVNQDCLRNEFDNIVEYNRHVGKNAEPLQALFVVILLSLWLWRFASQRTRACQRAVLLRQRPPQPKGGSVGCVGVGLFIFFIVFYVLYSLIIIVYFIVFQFVVVLYMYITLKP